MRKLIIILLFIPSTALFAQDFMFDLSKEICDCVTEKGFSKQDDSCMEENLVKYEDEIAEYYGEDEEYQKNMIRSDLIFYFADCPILNEQLVNEMGMDLSSYPWLKEKDCKKGLKGAYQYTDLMTGEIVKAEFDKGTYTESYTDQIINFSVEWEGCDATLTLEGGSGEGYTGTADEGSSYKMSFKRGNKKGMAGVIYLTVFNSVMPMPRLFTSMD